MGNFGDFQQAVAGKVFFYHGVLKKSAILFLGYIIFGKDIFYFPVVWYGGIVCYFGYGFVDLLIFFPSGGTVKNVMASHADR